MMLRCLHKKRRAEDEWVWRWNKSTIGWIWNEREARRHECETRGWCFLYGCTTEADSNRVRAVCVEKLDLWKCWQIGDQTVPVFTEARNVAHSIQLVGEIAVKASHKARLTELNMSDGTCLMCFMKFRRKVGILTRQPWNAVQLSIWVQKTLRNDAVQDQKRVLAYAHDVVQDQSLPWRKDMVLNVSRRRCVSMMNVLCWGGRAGDARSEWRLVTHAADHSEETMRIRIR